MKITVNRRDRRTAFRAAALFAGTDRTLDLFFAAIIFLHPAAKDARNHLTNSYRGGVLYRKGRLHKKSDGGMQKRL